MQKSQLIIVSRATPTIYISLEVGVARETKLIILSGFFVLPVLHMVSGSLRLYAGLFFIHLGPANTSKR